MVGKDPLISAIVTAHGEGALLRRSLNSLRRSVEFAARLGTYCQIIVVLDRADDATRRVATEDSALGDVEVLEVDFGDLGLARNSGVRASRGGVIAISDGDDYVSENWLHEAGRLIQSSDRVIAHPQLVILFGDQSGYYWQRSQRCRDFDPDCLLGLNPYNSCCAARRDTFLTVPYVPVKGGGSGFGYEDWHWNAETIASGFEHHVVERTVHFVRRKSAGSLSRRQRDDGALIPASRYFDVL